MSGWLVETLLATTLLMALVLLVRPAVRRGFGVGAAYALWLVPALRFVLPPLSVPEAIGLVPAVPVDIVFAATTGPGYGEWLMWMWAGGAALFAACHVIVYRRFVARAVRSGGRERSGVLVSDAVEGPAAVGLLHRHILVPRDFATRFDASERALAIRHERIHHARGDLWANAAALGMLSLHWFNPIAHRAFRAFREDQELSCDAAVIAGASNDEREAYGRAMVKSAWGTAPFMSCPMTRKNTNLKRRLKMVKSHKTSRLGKIGGIFSVSVMAIAGLTLTATGSVAAEPTENVIIKRVHGKGAGTAATNLEIEARCGNDPAKFETEAVSERDGKPVKTRLILCSKDGKSGGDRIAALEKARARIAATTDIEPANRAKVLSALDTAIAKLKASN